VSCIAVPEHCLRWIYLSLRGRNPFRRSQTVTERAVYANFKNRHKGVHLGLDPVICPSNPRVRPMTTARANGTERLAAIVKDLLVAANRRAEQV
jgi:hypothetical protein